MGSNVVKGSSLLESLPPSTPLHVVMLGLDSAGKTTALYRLKFDQYLNTVPTIGFNCEKIRGTTGRSKGASFLIWDVGGQDRIRPLWRAYTRCADGIVFVVDSGDEPERLEEARLELAKTLRSPESLGVPVLVLANKQDLPGARGAEEVARALGMESSELLATGQQWHVQPACAVVGDGLEEGLEALYDMILRRRRQLKQARKKLT